MTDQTKVAHPGDEQFISLTTFRHSGEPVSTPVWVGRDGDALVVTTPTGTGKVKRLRSNPAVEVVACTRRGKVVDGAPRLTGTAEIVTDPATMARLTRTIRHKYGLEFRLVMAIERLTRRQATRVLLRVTLG